ncbi:MAG: hypothetical protein U0840_07070 [Gemmataceae bacterium]
MIDRSIWAAVVTGLVLGFTSGHAAELHLPQQRTAYYASEPIEMAISGLASAKENRLEIVPLARGMKPLTRTIRGDGTTMLLLLAPGSLAVGEYELRLEGKPAAKISISAGVQRSPMLLSATVSNPSAMRANFLVGNAFNFGLFDAAGRPSLDVQGRRSQGMQVFDNAVRSDLPTLVYMYWTGYVTHKPFGSEKSWAAADMAEATRLLSLHTAQRLRRYRSNLLMIGTLDEPGLSWGKTPAGGMASGFPNWDEEAWYIKRGWRYTQDPASGSDSDWMQYMRIRCSILREVNAQARKDLQAFLPCVPFSTDLYAPQAIMDGTDPLNQQINDIPSSHVFLDWGCGKLGAHGGLYLEKSDNPSRKIAHAMNGQLFAPVVAQPNQKNAYRLMLNAMLAAGLHSNWWLNPTGMNPEDLAWVNEPALRFGGLFQAFRPEGHDVAVLWSFTEAAMRQKEVTAREARKKTGEQIKLMIAAMPDIPGATDKQVEINAYNVGGNYKEQVLTLHQAISRAGFPAHVLHQRVLAEQLDKYRVLCIVGQTFPFPPEVQAVLQHWVDRGGQIVCDATTTVKLPNALVTRVDLRDPGFRWTAYFNKAERKDHPFKSEREASFYLTNWFMDELARQATPIIRETLQKTRARPVLRTTSPHLAVDRHMAGKAQMICVMNAYEKLPDIPPMQRYPLYNHAEFEAELHLPEIPPGHVVYCVSGSTWSDVRKVSDVNKKL